ncbi:MAG: PaaX family transcriptional regulator C-terminal domain-containing protein [Luteolibacter sp.]|jgi:phenylacetic acid degradation operon negative regulatory protein|nr:PaaX family transcriptional regulator C-terminal domain-containing protein [Luteolibacter sp.]
MKSKTELILYHMFWVADYAMRPSLRRMGESFEEWAYHGGFLRQIQELERQGFLEAEEGNKGTKRVVRLTEKGTLRAMGGCDPMERWKRPWDGAWRMAVFDLPETQRKLRSKLRRELMAANFGCLQGSVWITPDALDGVLPSLGKHDVKSGTMMFFTGRPCGGESDADLVKAAWPVAAIDAAYQEHLAHLKSLPSVGSDPRDQLMAWGNLERRLWEKCMKLDPLLPRPLWPDSYPGERAWHERLKTLRTAGKIALEK